MKFLALMLALAECCLAQPNLVRGKKIVDEALQALGGDRFLAMEDRVESGRAYSFYRERLSGLSIAKIYTRYLSVAEGKTGSTLGVREKQAFGKAEDSGAIFREDGAWEYTFRGAKPFDDDRLARYRDTTLRNIFYILHFRLHEKGIIFEAQGAAVMDNQPVEVVDIIDAENRVVTVAFHQSTKLPIRQSYTWRDPKTRERNEEVTLFTKYRDAGGGVQWPHQIERERNGEKIYQIFSDTVTVNQNLTDSVFAIPDPVPPTNPGKRVTPGKK
jgi:hypothetical protein